MSPQSEPASYSYEPLDSTKRQIRLIKLLPQVQGAWQTTIDCSIFHANLDDYGTTYETLSYVWGSESKPYKIRIDEGHSLSVTSNLFSALLHLRQTDAPRTLWIDAMCIDQDSFREREQQISIMRDIYARASRTIIWLGEFSFAAVDGSKQFLSYISQRYVVRQQYVEDSSKAQAHVRNTIKIHSSAWFSRMWIVQELACSRDAVVYVGNDSVSWAALLWWMNKIIAPDAWKDTYDQYPQMTGYGRALNMFALDRQRRLYQEGTLSRLLYLIFELRTFQFTKDLDQVYALVGIASNQVGDDHAMRISYALTFKAMRSNLMRHHMVTSGLWERVLAAGAVQHMPSSSLTPMDPDQVADLLLRHSQEPPKHTSELLNMFPRAPYAPFQRDWLVEPPGGRDTHAALIPPDSVPYVRGLLIGFCHTPIGWTQLVYTNDTSPPMNLFLIEETPISFQIMEAFPVSESYAISITNRLRLFREECAKPDGSLVLKQWTSGVVPTVLTSRPIGRQEWTEGMYSMWNTLMMFCRWSVIGERGYFTEFQIGTPPEYVDEHFGPVVAGSEDAGSTEGERAYEQCITRYPDMSWRG